MLKLRSMTGFGSYEGINKNLLIKVEIRSLNGKFFDCSIRTSKIFKDKETEIRQWALETIGRGSIQINLTADCINPDTISNQIVINHKLAGSYKTQIDNLVQHLNIQNPDIFNYMMQLPDVVKIEDPKSADEDWTLAKESLAKAFERFDAFRVQEGETLRLNLEELIFEIKEHLNCIIEIEPKRKQDIRIKLQKSIDEIKESLKFDTTRFEYELLYYLEKLDIGEEISRLNNHINYFIETIKNEATGKKLGFISQEIGREINTIGSKANYFDIQKHVVEMKDVLEKIKEQVLNTL